MITYGIRSNATYTAKNIELGDRRVRFAVEREGAELGTIELSVPGIHNVYNALAALIVGLEAGLSFQQIAASLAKFRGAKRRFQVIGEYDDILVIDDYAHHPTEIEATITAAKSTGKRIIAVFQPQRYTRTYFLLEQFSRAFGEADEVILTDIFSPVGEKRIEGVSSGRLAELIAKNSNPNVRYIPDKDEVLNYLTEHIKPGDLVLTMGAGDIYKTAHALGRLLQSRQGIQ
jgi:UDP-N-acetylmuramate--alanine ligase